MEGAFAGEEALAQNVLGPLQGSALDELPVVGNQHVLDEVGMV
jgi:hypothetical protein